VDTTWCSDCLCLDPAYTGPHGTLAPHTWSYYYYYYGHGYTSDADCASPWYKADGECDDENNVAECEYDGGDCCGFEIVTTWCTECLCLDPDAGEATVTVTGWLEYGTYDAGMAGETTVLQPNFASDLEDSLAEDLDVDISIIYAIFLQRCGEISWRGDGSCDDENNNADCLYDGGDCCGAYVDTTWCSECACLDPAYTGTTAEATAGGDCASPYYQADGECDDENNVASCDYDGGDCCGAYVDTTWCSDCLCLDPAYTGPHGTLAPHTWSYYYYYYGHGYTSDADCASPWYKADGECDDENNVAECEYDGGDCCGFEIVTTWCTECLCLDPDAGEATVTVTGWLEYGTYDAGMAGETTVLQPNFASDLEDSLAEDLDVDISIIYAIFLQRCGEISWRGDGSCDDENNNADCLYDGGDCCGDSVDTTWCSECACKDPDYVGTTSEASTDDVEAMAVWQIYVDGNDGSVAQLTPDFGLTQKTVSGPWHVQFVYTFTNGCTATLMFNLVSEAVELESHTCGGDCTDNEQLAADVAEAVPVDLPGNSCAAIVDTMVNGWGFPCDASLAAIGVSMTLGDVCCATCAEMTQPATTEAQTTSADPCGSPNWAGDGNCDDQNNNAGCAYDGGDCCLATVQNNQGIVKTNYCDECACLDPNGQGPAPTTAESCGSPSFAGDGFCDDQNNNGACNYDGGDCCVATVDNNQGTVKTNYCDECACLDPSA